MSDDLNARREEGRQLRAWREGMGLSREQFAGMLGISFLTLKNAENGYQALGRRTLAEAERISLAHGCNAVAERPEPYGDAAPDLEWMMKVVAAVREPTVTRAAESLQEATGCTMDEALVMVVRKRLQRG